MNINFIAGIKHALESSDLMWLEVTSDEFGVYLEHNTDDNTSKQNYDDTLNDITEIRACLLPLNIDVEIAMADHDTIVYKVTKESPCHSKN